MGMEEVAKKLSLWDTQRFRPILTHEELEPIMTAVGFVPLPFPPPKTAAEAAGAVPWREYAFRASAAPRRTHPVLKEDASLADASEWLLPRFPFPRIDGLHLLVYQAFFEAVGFYIGDDRVADYFHVRAMPLSRALDRVFDRAYKSMRGSELDDEGIFVYREGTLDRITKMNFDHNNSSDNNNGNDGKDSSNKNRNSCEKDDNGTNSYNTSNTSNKNKDSNATSLTYLVPLKDLLPQRSAVMR